ncbi:hypothetical protein ES703_111653 [subsurface metagenome]
MQVNSNSALCCPSNETISQLKNLNSDSSIIPATPILGLRISISWKNEGISLFTLMFDIGISKGFVNTNFNLHLFSVSNKNALFTLSEIDIVVSKISTTLSEGSFKF